MHPHYQLPIIVPNMANVPDVSDSTTFCNSNFLEYKAEGNCPKDRVAAAMLGDTNPCWQGVATPPLLDPKRK